MKQDKEKIIKILVKQPYENLKFTQNQKANDLLKNIKKFPHAFVLACVMDSMINAEEAWLIPYKVSKQIHGFEFSKVLKLNQQETEQIFKKERIPRFWKKKAEYFYKAVQKIKEKYNGDASKIWANNPTSCLVVKRFLEFDGVGRKIATMSANILAREFKIRMKNYHCIDVSPDIQVKRVFKRLGLISKDSDDELMYITRDLNWKYPGFIDVQTWNIGRNYCHPQKPNCKKCPLGNICLTNKNNINSTS